MKDPRSLLAVGGIALAAALTAWLSMSGGDSPKSEPPRPSRPAPMEAFDLPPASTPVPDAAEPQRSTAPPVPADLTVSPAMIDLLAGTAAAALVSNRGGTGAVVNERVVAGSGLTASGCAGALEPGATCRLDLLGQSPGAGEVLLLGPQGVWVRIPFQVRAAPSAPAPASDPLAELVAVARAARLAGLARGRAVETPVDLDRGRLSAGPLPTSPASPPALSQPDYGADFPKALSTLPVDLSRTVLQDTPIPVTLLDSINSQIPGPVRAQVDANVFGADGETVVIPYGSILNGRYEGMKQGQTRLPVMWTRIVRARDHAQFDLRGAAMPATDEMGRVGLFDRLDERTMDRYGGAVLATLFDIAAAVAENQLSNTTQQSGSTVVMQDRGTQGGRKLADMVLERNIDLTPVHTVAQGKQFLVRPARDLWLVRPAEVTRPDGDARPSGGTTGEAVGGIEPGVPRDIARPRALPLPAPSASPAAQTRGDGA